MKQMKHPVTLGLFVAIGALLATPAQAQFNGSHTLGDFGVKPARNPPPGSTQRPSTIATAPTPSRTGTATRSLLSPGSSGSLGIDAYAPILWYVSQHKVLGANYGAMAVFPWANGALEAPIFGLDQKTRHALRRRVPPPDRPGLARAARPTSQRGSGCMCPPAATWTAGARTPARACRRTSPSWGATLYLDEKKTFSLATNVYWEFHGTKKDSDVQVGQILTLEGGLGKSYLGGGLIVGASYYAQWKVTADSIGKKTRPSRRRDRRTAALEHQAQGLRPRAGRDPPDRDQEEAVRARQRPLLLGDGRPDQDARADAHHHGDVPDPEREALGVARTADECGLDLIKKRRKAR